MALSFLTALSAFIALEAVLFSCFAEYTRMAPVSGYLAPTHGLIKVYAPQSGPLTEKHVDEGPRVKQGDALYVLSTGRSSLHAREAQAAAIAQLRERRASLAHEIEQQAARANLAHRESGERVRGMGQRKWRHPQDPQVWVAIIPTVSFLGQKPTPTSGPSSLI